MSDSMYNKEPNILKEGITYVHSIYKEPNMLQGRTL
jgi:hypothetical protein